VPGHRRGTAEQRCDTGCELDPGGPPDGPRPVPERLLDLVTEMGDCEMVASLDEVWGVPDARADSGPVGH